jgi:hypothetical protein
LGILAITYGVILCFYWALDLLARVDQGTLLWPATVGAWLTVLVFAAVPRRRPHGMAGRNRDPLNMLTRPGAPAEIVCDRRRTFLSGIPSELRGIAFVSGEFR